MPTAEVIFHDEFAAEFRLLAESVQDRILAHVRALQSEGYELGRPWADTLKGSKFKNMKELRPTVNKVEWRVAFAFDSFQRGVLLAAAAKGGKKDSLVYGRLIATADARFAAHQAGLEPRQKGKK
ncbi:MAG: type II toxin-antitoxin system RelE/ParE family toxin [Hyphomicrobiales bacterium]